MENIVSTGDVLLVQLICCAIMTGVIWLVQLILYPAFHFIEPSRFSQFHANHTSRMGIFVGPVMSLEMITAGMAVIFASDRFIGGVNLFLVVILWIFTFFVSVPLHNRLARGFDLGCVRQLIRTNWPRTMIWTLRLLILAIIFIRHVQRVP